MEPIKGDKDLRGLLRKIEKEALLNVVTLFGFPRVRRAVKRRLHPLVGHPL